MIRTTGSTYYYFLYTITVFNWSFNFVLYCNELYATTTSTCTLSYYFRVLPAAGIMNSVDDAHSRDCQRFIIIYTYSLPRATQFARGKAAQWQARNSYYYLIRFILAA